MMEARERDDLRRSNLRTALILAAVVLAFFFGFLLKYFARS